MSGFWDIENNLVVAEGWYASANTSVTEAFGQGIRLGGFLPPVGDEVELDVEPDLLVSPSRLEHVFRFVANTPWAIQPEILAVITDLLTYRMAGYRLNADEVEERIGRPPEQPFYAGTLEARVGGRTSGQGGAVALLSLYGVIAPRASMVDSVSGPAGTGLDEFSSILQNAVDDPEVGAIVIDVNSPGGTVDMVPETGERIRRARASKPIYAVANTQAGSAAYWLASQATELVATQSGEVGSIGVYAAHQDISGELEQAGRKVTLVSAGKYKTELNPFEALTAEARDALQSDIDEYYGMFIDAVAKGRDVKSSVVREGYGEGRMLSAKKALSAGMIDRVDTLEGTVNRALRGGGRGRGRATSFAGVTFPDNENSEPSEEGPSSLDHVQHLHF